MGRGRGDSRNILLGKRADMRASVPELFEDEDYLFEIISSGDQEDFLLEIIGREYPGLTEKKLSESRLINPLFESFELPPEIKKTKRAEELYKVTMVTSLFSYIKDEAPFFFDTPMLINTPEQSEILYGRDHSKTYITQNPWGQYIFRLLCEERNFQRFFEEVLPVSEKLKSLGHSVRTKQFYSTMIAESLVGGHVFSLQKYKDEEFNLHLSIIRPINHWSRLLQEWAKENETSGIHDPYKLLDRLRKIPADDSNKILEELNNHLDAWSPKNFVKLHEDILYKSVEKSFGIIAANNLPDNIGLAKYDLDEMIEEALLEVRPVTLLRRMKYLVQEANREDYLKTLAKNKDKINNDKQEVLNFINTLAYAFIDENRRNETGTPFMYAVENRMLTFFS